MYVCYKLLMQGRAFLGGCDLFRPTTLSLTEFSCQYELPICFQGLTSRYKCLILKFLGWTAALTFLGLHDQKLKSLCLISLTDNKY